MLELRILELSVNSRKTYLLMESKALWKAEDSIFSSCMRIWVCSKVTDIAVLSFALLQLVTLPQSKSRHNYAHTHTHTPHLQYAPIKTQVNIVLPKIISVIRLVRKCGGGMT